jgi:site-specific recombinase XerD
MKDRKRTIEFEDGVFKDLWLQFIQYKRDSGFKYSDSPEYTMRVLNRNLNTYNLNTPCLTKEMVEQLAAKKANESRITQSKRISILRHFALFMIHMGLAAYVYPIKYKANDRSSFVPYIFTRDQIKAIFTAADSLKPLPKHPRYHLVYPTLVRILYGCGLRI